jgi:mycofactocin precursor
MERYEIQLEKGSGTSQVKGENGEEKEFSIIEEIYVEEMAIDGICGVY